MNGFMKELIVIPIVGAWIASFEVRLRNKVGRKEFELIVAQGIRLESHIWDIMKAQKIKPTIEPPDEIKNNSMEIKS